MDSLRLILKASNTVLKVMEALQRSNDEWWWCREEALAHIGASLRESYVAIIDEFLPLHELEGVHSEVKGAYDNGLLSHNGLIGFESDVQSDETVRGDLVGFFESKKGPENDMQYREGWGKGIILARALEKMNTIVCELRDSPGCQATLSELKTVSTRSRAMVTCYPGQQRAYTKHCDNAVRNGRKLTAILYLNPHWTSQDGGELKIHPNHSNIGGSACQDKLKRVFGFNQSTCSVTNYSLSVQPIANRLVLFWSNMRCPHEVLPTHKPRFAVTLWFIDGNERDQTAALKASAAAADAKQKNADVLTAAKEGCAVLEETSCANTDAPVKEPALAESCIQVIYETAKPPISAMSLPVVTLLTESNGEADVWCAEEQCLLYRVYFSDPSLVPHTLVDVVNNSVLRIHTADHAFALIEIPIQLPIDGANSSIQESRTTAKFNRKKNILSVRLFFGCR